MLAASLAAASMDPLGVWIAHLRGFPVPSLPARSSCACPTIRAPSSPSCRRAFLQRMGRRLREAEDLGSYRLVELLGHGGMGEVWRAQHRLLARHAAIKLVRPEVLGAGSPRKRSHAHAPVRARGPGHGGAQLSPHHSAVRFRPDRRWHVLLRDGAADRARPRNAGPGIRSAARRTARCSCSARCATRWPTRTPAASSTATSSRPISTSAAWASTTTS